MRRRDTLLGDPPKREFTRVTELIGPRGGVVYVLHLTCGHWLTLRKLPRVMKTEVPCVGCLVEAALKAKP